MFGWPFGPLLPASVSQRRALKLACSLPSGVKQATPIIRGVLRPVLSGYYKFHEPPSTGGAGLGATLPTENGYFIREESIRRPW